MKTIISFAIASAFLIAMFGDYKESKSTEKYKVLNEEELKRLNELKKEVKKVPETEYKLNYDIYEELVDLNSSNKYFKEKLAYYKRKNEIMRAVASNCRISGRKQNKNLLNYPETYDSITYFDKYEGNKYYFEEQFTGKNAFGVPAKFVSQYKCTLKKNNTIEINRLFFREDR